jgi:SSS family solute:Na+ symporter
MFKLTVQAFFGADKIDHPAFWAAIGDFNFLYATGALFAISSITIVSISLLTSAQSDRQICGLTYASIHKESADEIRASWDGWNKLMAGLILLLVLGMYLYFSFWL